MTSVKRSRTIAAVTALTAALVCATSCYAGEVDQLLVRVPARANAVAFVDLDGLLRTTVAREEKWREQIELNYLGGTLPFPPETSGALVCGQVEASTQTSAWEIGLFAVGKKLQFDRMAKAEKGFEGTIGGGVPMVHLPSRNSYFVQFSGDVLGVATPAKTQEVSQWVKDVKGLSKPQVSDFLRTALTSGTRGQIIMALDTSESINESAIKNNVAQLKSLQGKSVNANDFARFLASAKGVRFSIRVEKGFDAELAVTFGDDASKFADVLPEAVKEILGVCGYPPDEFGQWQTNMTSDGVFMRGKLTPMGFRRALAIVRPSNVPPSVLEHDLASPQGPQAAVTKRYFLALEKQISDAQALAAKSSSYNSAANEFERFAKQIERLPRANVDPDLQNAAARICLMLRAVSTSYRGAKVDYDSLEAQKKSEFWVNPGGAYAAGGWGWGGGFGAGYYHAPSFWTSNNYQEVNEKQVKAVGESRKDRDKILTDLSQELTTAREQLAARYKVSF